MLQSFCVVSGRDVQAILGDGRQAVVDLVRETYIAHHHDRTVNPNSYFLRFPDNPASRIIALPSALRGENGVAGIKWIASFPANIEANLPRASAVLILNDAVTGYPFACLEASLISSARTAASAALAAINLRPQGYAGSRISIVGAGAIARNVFDYLLTVGARPDQFVVHDLDPGSAEKLIDYITERSGIPASAADLDGALECETVVFVTTAGEPYVHRKFAPGQLVLNVSLRDIAPEVIIEAANLMDDVDHCLNANTSPHLAEQMTGGRDFIDGTLADVLEGTLKVPTDRPVVFSPFGLGVLDLALGMHIYEQARTRGATVEIPDFFAETQRWPSAGGVST